MRKSVEIENGFSFFNIQYPGGDGEELNLKSFTTARKRFLASAHHHTTAEVQPSASPLHAKRKQRALQRRPAATTTAERAATHKQKLARAARLSRRRRS